MLTLRSQESNHISLIDCNREFTISQNPFESLVVDITNQCNMRCNFCYNPVRSNLEMSVDFFENLCSLLPFPVYMKLGGGEPTLHPHLIEFIRIALRYRHKVYVASNGLMYREPFFMDSLKGLKGEGLGFCLGLSMDGGYSNKYAYKAINGGDYLLKKIEAFQSLVSYKLGRVSLSAMIVRGLNEDVIPHLINLAYKHSKVIRFIHFRNVARVGRWMNTKPYSIYELKELVSRYFSEDEFKPKCIGELHCPPESGKECCYRFRPTNRLQVSIIEFVSERSAKCPKRWRLVNGTYMILPLFESMK